VFSNDLDQSLIFVAIFLTSIFTLPLLLAWMEQPHDVGRALRRLVERGAGRDGRAGSHRADVRRAGPGDRRVPRS
jgi:hypothetical protein